MDALPDIYAGTHFKDLVARTFARGERVPVVMAMGAHVKVGLSPS